MTTALRIPAELLPSDGRFGSGPSKVRQAQADAVAAAGRTLLGTSHRQPPVRALVAKIRTGLAELFDIPTGYEIVLGNGGATLFWDIAAFSLVHEQAQHLVCGEFSAKFAHATAAPFLKAPEIRRSEPGSVPHFTPRPGIDSYAWPHNETSTGAVLPVRRVHPADAGALMLVDATSAAAGIPVDISETDVYYFAPQKGLASDGGLWCAVLSPAALARVEQIHASGRWIPAGLSLQTAVLNSRQDQTYNTPALATLIMLAEQLDWLLARGGLDWATARTAQSAKILYSWAEKSDFCTPFVAQAEHRSPVVGTIDFAAEIPAAEISRILRMHGVVDVDPYRKLGRNQLRVGMFPAVEPADVAALTTCLDYLVARLG